MELDFYIEEYAKLSITEKDLTRILFAAECKFQRGKNDFVAFKKSTLAKFSKCCTKTVQRFHAKVRYYLIGVKIRWKADGNQGASHYAFDKEFFKAMCFMDRQNLLYKSRKHILKFLESYRQNKNVPLSNEKCPPSYSSSSHLTDGRVLLAKEVRIYPSLEPLEMQDDVKKMLSLYPERCVVLALEDKEAFCDKWKRTIDDLSLFMTAQVQRHAGTRPKQPRGY